jgi:hypothetical protein
MEIIKKSSGQWARRSLIEVLPVRIVFGATFPINLANVLNTHLNALVAKTTD